MESPSVFCGQQSETSLQQNLVMQYLAHEGYVETVRLFTEHVYSSSKLLHGTNSVHTISEHKEDPDAVNRQSESPCTKRGCKLIFQKSELLFLPATSIWLSNTQMLIIHQFCRKMKIYTLNSDVESLLR